MVSIGIYKIVSPNGRIYIGQSNDIKRRWREYKTGKGRGQIKLKNSFAKYGVNAHTFSIITTCEISELNNLERYFQELYNATGKNGLNCVLVESDERKREHSIESKIELSKKLKDILNNPIIREKMSLCRMGEKNHFFNKKHSEKTKEAISIARKGNTVWIGKTHTDESKLKMSISRKGLLNGERNGMFGKNHTDATKLKIIANRNTDYTGGKNPSAKIVIDFNTGIFYGTCKEASIISGIGYSYLSGMLSGNFPNKTSFSYC